MSDSDLRNAGPSDADGYRAPAPAWRDDGWLLQHLRAGLGARYQLHDAVGHGGMAVVFKAWDERLRRWVAVKVLRPELASAVGAARFLDEVHIAAALQHANILAVHDAGETADGLLYYTMPFVAGESLRARLRREKQLSVAEAVHVAEQVASGLAHAHLHDVVHRDIKPENVLLDGDHACIADFGIARALAAAPGERRTATGVSIGTPEYMSPEQAGGARDLDGRSDVYSLGCVLFEMLAGRPPFTGETAHAIIAQHMVQPAPPVTVFRPATPPALAAVVERALAKTPADRWRTAGDLVAALRDAASGAPISSAAPPAAPAAGRARWRRVAAVALVAAAVGGVVALRAARRAAPGPTVVVLPFEHAGAAPALDGVNCQVLMHDAVERWPGLRVVRLPRANDQLTRVRGGTGAAARLGAARALHASLGIWGDVTQLGGAVVVRATLHDVGRGGRALRRAEVRIVDLRLADSLFGVLADSLVSDVVRTHPESVPGATGTRDEDARVAYLRGYRALLEWDMRRAAAAFDSAVHFDAAYADAYLQLAVARSWGGDEPEGWRDAAGQAVRLRTRLAPEERALAEALWAEGRRDFPGACERFERLVRRDGRDFAASFGLGQCLSLDDAVVPDPRSPTGWGFRSSYRRAIEAYGAAFESVPSSFRMFRGRAFDRLRTLLRTRTDQLRRGHRVGDGAGFFAYPALHADTLAFFPRPDVDARRGAPGMVPATVVDAVVRNQETLRGIAASWVSAYPREPDALEALAVAMELTASPDVVDTLRRAARYATDPAQRLRLATDELWVRVKAGAADRPAELDSARRLADSLLAASGAAAGRDAELLAGVAALTGHADAGAALAERGATAVPVMAGGRLLTLTRPTVAAAERFTLYAALGAPAESIAATGRRARERLAGNAPRGALDEVRGLLLRRGASLAFGSLSASALDGVRPDGDYLIEAQSALLRRDTARVRRTLDSVWVERRSLRASDLTFDGLLPEASLLLAVGDTARALDWLAPSLDALASFPPQGLTSAVRTACLVRAMALRAELAHRAADRSAARGWARAVLTLWSGADAAFTPLLDRMALIARS